VKDGQIIATVPVSVTPNPFDEVLVVATVGYPEGAQP